MTPGRSLADFGSRLPKVMDVLVRMGLSPLLVAQGIFVIAKALRLPEASGDRSGVFGEGPRLRLLLLGDSSAAGVGVETQDAALSGRLVEQLSGTFRLEWALDAKTGATTKTTLKRLDTSHPYPVDAVVVALGVNDTTRFVSRRRWRQRQTELLDRLSNSYGARQLYVSGVPPLGQFPLLPQPLRWVLGRHAAQLDDELRKLLSDRPNCHYITVDLPPDPALMAEDGFHPGAAVYQAWAEALAEKITSDFADRLTDPAQRATRR